MFNSSIKGRIISNHVDKEKRLKDETADTTDINYLSARGSWSKQYQDLPDDSLTRVWQKLTPAAVVEMLINAASRPHPLSTGKSTSYLASEMLREMRHSSWVIKGTAHAGGQNNSTSADPELHITVKLGTKRARHLTCREQPRLHIIKISEED
ncbi:hypothetical protein POL68_22065 [Stigmatella sp. ncwal1]|uniref:Uncharacterized protein n=1 Tax=Stigmatella ashevillensis TaxID=2995309 RepID=A0ABT5DCC0_9BACT|nr:hypothetical protein [Stigmatella ashevillena]MDC0711171.1 hypothetical protein [Stigmatella ashevillena]